MLSNTSAFKALNHLTVNFNWHLKLNYGPYAMQSANDVIEYGSKSNIRHFNEVKVYNQVKIIIFKKHILNKCL